MNDTLKALILALLIVLISSISVAQTRNWTNGSGTNRWSDAGNWTGNNVPDSPSEDAVFGAANPDDCEIDMALSIGSVTINPGYSGTITQQSGIAILLTGNYDQSGGTFNGADASITIRADFILQAGGFTSTSALLTVGGDFANSGGTFSPNSGSVSFLGGADTNLSDNLNTTTFYNLTIDKSNFRGVYINFPAQLEVSNDLILHAGFISGRANVQGDVTVESNFENVVQGLYFRGSQTSVLKVDPFSTFYDTNIFIEKDNATDTVSIEAIDDMSTIELGGIFSSILDIFTGVVAFGQGEPATFNFDEVRIRNEGTLVGTADTLTVNSRFFSNDGIFKGNGGTVVFAGTNYDTDFSDNLNGVTFHNLVVEKQGLRGIFTGFATEVTVSNDLTLRRGFISGRANVQGDVTVESNFENVVQGLYFRGSQTSVLKVDPFSTFYDTNIFIEKDNATDTVSIEAIDDMSTIELGGIFSSILDIFTGVVAFGQGEPATFNFDEVRIRNEGTLVGTADTLTVNSRFFSNDGIFKGNGGTVVFAGTNYDTDFSDNLNGVTFHNLVVEKQGLRGIFTGFATEVTVSNDLTLRRGFISGRANVQGDVTVESNFENVVQGLYFRGSQTSVLKVDPFSTFYDTNIFIEKDNATDTVSIEAIDDMSTIELGGIFSSILDIFTGVVAFGQGEPATFNFDEVRIRNEGTLVGTADTLTVNSRFFSNDGIFKGNGGTVVFAGTNYDTDFSDNLNGATFHNLVVEKQGLRGIFTGFATEVTVSNDLTLRRGFISGRANVQGDVTVESNFENVVQGLYFRGSQTSVLKVDPFSTFYDTNIFIEKDNATDTVSIEAIDDMSTIELGGIFSSILDIFTGVVAFGQGEPATFNFDEVRIRNEGTLVGTADTLTVNSRFLSNDGVLKGTEGMWRLRDQIAA